MKVPLREFTPLNELSLLSFWASYAHEYERLVYLPPSTRHNLPNKVARGVTGRLNAQLKGGRLFTPDQVLQKMSALLTKYCSNLAVAHAEGIRAVAVADKRWRHFAAMHAVVGGLGAQKARHPVPKEPEELAEFGHAEAADGSGPPEPVHPRGRARPAATTTPMGSSSGGGVTTGTAAPENRVMPPSEDESEIPSAHDSDPDWSGPGIGRARGGGKVQVRDSAVAKSESLPVGAGLPLEVAEVEPSSTVRLDLRESAELVELSDVQEVELLGAAQVTADVTAGGEPSEVPSVECAQEEDVHMPAFESGIVDNAISTDADGVADTDKNEVSGTTDDDIVFRAVPRPVSGQVGEDQGEGNAFQFASLRDEDDMGGRLDGEGEHAGEDLRTLGANDRIEDCQSHLHPTRSLEKSSGTSTVLEAPDIADSKFAGEGTSYRVTITVDDGKGGSQPPLTEEANAFSPRLERAGGAGAGRWDTPPELTGERTDTDVEKQPEPHMVNLEVAVGDLDPRDPETMVSKIMFSGSAGTNDGTTRTERGVVPGPKNIGHVSVKRSAVKASSGLAQWAPNNDTNCRSVKRTLPPSATNVNTRPCKRPRTLGNAAQEQSKGVSKEGAREDGSPQAEHATRLQRVATDVKWECLHKRREEVWVRKGELEIRSAELDLKRAEANLEFRLASVELRKAEQARRAVQSEESSRLELIRELRESAVALNGAGMRAEAEGMMQRVFKLLDEDCVGRPSKGT